MDKPQETRTPTKVEIAKMSLRRANAITRDQTQKPILDAIARAGLGGAGKDGEALKKAVAERDTLKAELAKVTAERDALKLGLADVKATPDTPNEPQADGGGLPAAPAKRGRKPKDC